MLGKKNGQLEVEEDFQFQLGSWRLQRVGWFCFVMIIFGSLLGLAGDGPLAERSRDAGSFTMSYSAIMVLGRQSKMLIRIKTFHISAIPKEPTALRIRGDLHKFQEIKFIPQPSLLEPSETSFTATFNREVQQIAVALTPEHWGRAQIEVTLEDVNSEAVLWILP